ncbi:YbfB/YjiJ family MFS transporter [Neorhizobium lilium]|uniref:YbfB/YjiJ family MFS transporter n=1 Tax=Neorhizobium lilium TaxID=2503024 RepID=A0A3S3TZV5_9HYPH|nr:YbfB/YjiJ family MFS transporter [Neorhizobium lilium]RWX78702.1 YbfB/YjiJ family MFS transporter [Neorhizobium lilium]
MLQMSSSSSGRPLLTGFAGAIAMAAAMGFGRFFYTPILPGMMAGIPLSAADAGYVAAGNFAGYLAGAILSAFGWAAGRERRVALGGLFATAVLLALMAATTSVPAFIVIRFLAGLASALAMIFTSSIVLPHAAGRNMVSVLHFGGVGVGIALSSALVLAVNTLAGDGAHGWRINWLAGAAIVLAVFLIVIRILPRPIAGGARVVEPPLDWRLPLVLITASYGLFGFGYVITATFLVTIARQGAAGPLVEFLAWFVTGCAAAISLLAWQPAVRRIGLAKTYLAAILALAVGVVGSVSLPPMEGALVGGLLLGATFMVVTAFGLQIGRNLTPQSPRRAFAFMTAAFGTGQIIGPLVAGWLAEWSGSFTAPTLAAAGVLVVCVILAFPLALRRL